MTNKKFGKILIFTVFFLFTLGYGLSADALYRDLDESIPMDPQLVKKTLDNGLTFYVKENSKPENRIVLRLVVRAGSILEEESQRGLAHFLEHMAFNGTTNFPGNSLIDRMELEGIRFGADMNAYTGYDNTVFMLDIPAGRDDLLDTALLVLSDWAEGITNSIEEIEKERGVVIEEWRKSRGADERIGEIQRKAIFHASRYADRQPIGELEVLENFTRDDIVSFYKDWYRPDLMAVIAVGNFDKSVIEEKIRERFSSLPLQKLRKKRLEYPVPGRSSDAASIVVDSEASSAEIKVIYFLDNIEQNSVRDYRNNLMVSLYLSMLNNRYDERRQEKNPPFINAGAGFGSLTADRAVFTAVCTADPGNLNSGIEALASELSRLRDHGFTDPEFRRAKDRYVKFMEQLFLEAGNTHSETLASEYARNFLDGEYVPGIKHEYELTLELIRGIDIDEVNSLSRFFIRDEGALVMLSAPESPAGADSLPSEETLLASYRKALETQYPPYVDDASDDDLIGIQPQQGGERAKPERHDEANGIKYYSLSNGASIVIKQTDFRNDQILFSAFSPGGHSLVSDDEWITANLAAGIVSRGKIGNYNRTQLDKHLEGKIVSLAPFIGETSEGFSGSSSVSDIETLFQLMYLYFTGIEKDHDSFDSYISRLTIYMMNQDADPDVVFGRKLMTILSSGHPRGRPFDSSIIPEIDLDTAYSVFKERFANPGDFTYVFTGSAGPEVILPLAEKYLSMQASEDAVMSDRNETWKDLGMRLPAGKVSESILMGKEDKAQVALVFKGSFDWSRENLLLLTALAEAADMRLRNVIREDEGGTYSISVYPSVDKYPVSQYQITVYFACSPSRAEGLKEIALKELSSLSEMVPEGAVQKFRNASVLELQRQLKENSFWLAAIKDSEFDNSGLEWLDSYKAMIEKITPEDIMKAASLYLDTDSIIDLTMYPEEMKK